MTLVILEIDSGVHLPVASTMISKLFKLSAVKFNASF